MEYHQTQLLYKPNYFTTPESDWPNITQHSVLKYQFMETEEPDTPNISQDSIFDDQFVERLLQIETELSTEMGLDNSNGNSNSSDRVSEKNQQNFGLHTEENNFNSLSNLLFTGAKAVEASNWPLACNVIARLTNILSDRENKENPLNNMLVYFTRGLRCKSRNACEMSQEFVPSHTVTMPSFCMLLQQSPYVQFAHFTANQAILEATQGEDELHVIDFDIMEGIQWPPLMADLALRKNVSMGITAIIVDPKNAGTIQHTGRRLTEFADSIDLPFKFNQMVLDKEDDFDRIEVGHTVIANCAIHQLHMPTRNFSLVRTFMNGVSRLSPKMVVLVEEELLSFARIASMSFGEFFSEAFQHYTALSDSLIHSFSNVGFRLIESEIIGVRILDCVRNFPIEKREKLLWEEGFSLFKSLKPIPLSHWNVSQAKLLAGIFGRGYWMQHQDCRLSLCWKGRPLTTASVWVPTNRSSK